MNALPLAFAVLLATAVTPARAATDGANDPPPQVVRYDVRIDPDLKTKALRGRTSVRFRVATSGQDRVAFDAGALSIDSVRADGRRVSFEKNGRQVVVDLGRPAAVGRTYELDFFYHGAPREGIEFHPARGEVYTIYSSSEWMVCLDSPSVRAPLVLQVAVPAGAIAVGSGQRVGKTALDDGRTLYTWNEPRPMPSFAYGFAAGNYRMVGRRSGAKELQFLSVERSPAELAAIFADSAGMIEFFERKSGIPYRGVYAQVLVADTAGQEANRFAMLSEEYGKEVLDRQASDPTATALIAHEIAHQWWGTLVTNASWNHFWLNEGFAVFMTAAYFEQRFGSAVYEGFVERWRARVRAVAARGNDRALVFDNWNSPTADDRTVVYQRGALVLHELRRLLGDAAFWRGIRRYTTTFQGQSVVTDDFRRAMEQSSGRDLRAFFETQVYATPRPN